MNSNTSIFYDQQILAIKLADLFNEEFKKKVKKISKKKTIFPNIETIYLKEIVMELQEEKNGKKEKNEIIQKKENKENFSKNTNIPYNYSIEKEKNLEILDLNNNNVNFNIRKISNNSNNSNNNNITTNRTSKSPNANINKKIPNEQNFKKIIFYDNKENDLENKDNKENNLENKLTIIDNNIINNDIESDNKYINLKKNDKDFYFIDEKENLIIDCNIKDFKVNNNNNDDINIISLNKPQNQLYRKRDKSRFDFANKNNLENNVDSNIYNNNDKSNNININLHIEKQVADIENKIMENKNNINNCINNNNNYNKENLKNLNISKIILIKDEDLNKNLNKPKKITLNSIVNSNNNKDKNNNKLKIKKIELIENEKEKDNKNDDHNKIPFQKYKKINLIPNVTNTTNITNINNINNITKFNKENEKENENEELVPDYVSDVIRKKISRHTFFKKFENVFFDENEDNDYLHFEKELNRNDSWSQFIVSNLVKTIRLTNEV